MTFSRLVAAVGVCLIELMFLDMGRAEDTIDFKRDVAPILSKHCIGCHGPQMQMGDLRLDSRDAAMDVIESGDVENSLLVARIVSSDEGILMPPTILPVKQGLPNAELDVLKSWIVAGAKWPRGERIEVRKINVTKDAAAVAMFAAIRRGDHKTIGQLIKTSPNIIGALDRFGDTPLLKAAHYGDATTVRMLVEAGAKVRVKSPGGLTPLMLAAGSYDIVEYLLKHKANVKARAPDGRSPLLMAATYAGNIDVLKLMISKGADPAAKDKKGTTSLANAARRQDIPMLEELLKYDHDASTGFLLPPLLQAAQDGSLEVVSLLLERGNSSVKKTIHDALTSAARSGSPEIVALLLKEGANVNTRNLGYKGYTALMLAAFSDSNNAQVVKNLLAAGADPTVKTLNGETALSLARKRGQTPIVSMLEDALRKKEKAK